MHLSLFTAAILLSSSSHHARAIDRRAPAQLPLAPTIMTLKTIPNAPHLVPPSSQHLARRRLPHGHLSKRQIAAQTKLLTLGGRVYMTDITLRGDPYTLVIDTGSSDTWVPASFFLCLNPATGTPYARGACGFNASYDPRDSPTWKSIPDHDFAVNYTGGEFLRGELGVEELGIGNVESGARGKGRGRKKQASGRLVVNQTIGVVEEGFWRGDGVSSGLMGLAYPALVSGAGNLGYQSVMFSLTSHLPSRLFSLALSRPSLSNPTAGGTLSIGGLPPNPPTPFTTVPTIPIQKNFYAWYSLLVTRFAVTFSASSTASTRQRTPPPGSNNTANTAVVAIIDSGTSLMYIPDAMADYIARAFVPPGRWDSAVGLWMVRCDAVAPRVGVVIGGTTFWVSEVDLMNLSVGAVGRGGGREAGGECVLGVQRAGEGSVVLGDVWLKNVMVVFDLGGGEIRIAGREVY